MNQKSRLSPTKLFPIDLGQRELAYALPPNQHGLRVVNFQNGGYGVMNEHLQIITKKRFDDICLERNGMIRAWKNGQEIQINSSGKIIK